MVRRSENPGWGQIEDVEQAMTQVVNDSFFDGAFFVTLLQGGYSREQIRYFAIQYSYYSRHFPRVLGAAIAAMEPQSRWWIPLADNIWDEAGRGHAGRSHEMLYRTFLLSVDPALTLDGHGFPAVAMSAAVSEAVQTFIAFFQQATPLEAMAAVGLGSEFFAGDVMGAIGTGLSQECYNVPTKLDLTFWHAHADEHEPRHYQLCKSILSEFADPQSLQTMYRVGSDIARSEAAMYDQLHAEMLHL